ncbi:hypothetical protein ACFQJD_13625 [Haloplanus sp. GCM10025708]
MKRMNTPIRKSAAWTSAMAKSRTGTVLPATQSVPTPPPSTVGAMRNSSS